MLGGCSRLGLVLVRLLLSESFNQRSGLCLFFFAVILSYRWLGEWVGQALQEVLELLVLVDGALTGIVPTSASWHTVVRGEFERRRAHESPVLVGFGGIVEGQFPDVVAEWGNVSLRYDVKVCPGRLRRLRCAGILLEWIPWTSDEEGGTYSLDTLPFL
jgi:hypothetical protein